MLINCETSTGYIEKPTTAAPSLTILSISALPLIPPIKSILESVLGSLIPKLAIRDFPAKY